MISEGSRLNIIDNSGAVEGKCIKIIWPKSGHGRRTGREGDIIVLTITKTIPESKVKKGDVMRGLIVRTVNSGRGVRGEDISSESKHKGIVVSGKRGGMEGHRQSYGDNSVILVKMGAGGGAGGGKIKKIREVTPIGTRAQGPLGDRVTININNSKVTAILG